MITTKIKTMVAFLIGFGCGLVFAIAMIFLFILYQLYKDDKMMSRGFAPRNNNDFNF